MDDGDLPPVPLLPLFRPAAQALNDNPDAPRFPESTGEDTSQASDMVIIDDSAPASSSSFLETNENKDGDIDEEPPLPVGGAPPPVPTSASTVTTPRPTPNNSDARPGIRALIDVLPLPPDGKSTSQDEDPAPGAGLSPSPSAPPTALRGSTLEISINGGCNETVNSNATTMPLERTKVGHGPHALSTSESGAHLKCGSSEKLPEMSFGEGSRPSSPISPSPPAGEDVSLPPTGGMQGLTLENAPSLAPMSPAPTMEPQQLPTRNVAASEDTDFTLLT